jgi:hypothetical protein
MSSTDIIQFSDFLSFATTAKSYRKKLGFILLNCGVYAFSNPDEKSIKVCLP